MSNLPFPEKILQQHSATLGKTGAGKSSAMRVVFEHLLDHKKRVCIIDPKGDWWGLKSSKDGKHPGYAVIAFGNFKEPRATDVPIDEHSGKYVAELIATGNRPCIVGFRGWMPAQMVRFWIDFASTLFNTNEGELYVGIDEVHNFAAKGKIMDPLAGKCLHWTNRIINEGRGLGMTFFIASQRAQKVHNDTLDACETLIAMRVAHPAARKSIEDWINSNGDPVFGKEILTTLAQLKRGEAWVWSPENEFGPKRVQFPMFATFDSFAPPQLQKKISQSGWSEVDLDQVRQKFATVIAEAKANDPTALKSRVKELQQTIAKLEKQKTAPIGSSAPQTVDPKQIERAIQQATASFRKQLNRIQAATKEIAGHIYKANVRLGEIAAFELPKMEPIAVSVARQAEISTPRTAPIKAMPTNGNGNGDISGPEQRILNSIAWLKTIGVDRPEQTAVAFLAGYTIGGGAFSNPRGRLNQRGFVAYAGDRIELTEAGEKYAQAPDAPLDAAELQRLVLSRLPGPESKLLRVLIDNRGGLSNEELAAATGYAVGGGAFSNPRGRLRSLGLIDYSGGKVVPKPLLFLEQSA
jgi:hypothetical protein